MIDLSPKVTLVTGAARGIGAAIAEFFAANGAHVVVTDVLDDIGRHTVARIRAAGGQASYHHLNVANEAHWEAAMAHTVQTFGGLDVVVNNAAIELFGLIDHVEMEDVQRLLDVNVKGTLLGNKYAVRTMRKGGAGACGGAGGGSIVNLSSVAGLVGTPALAAYSASKGAIRAMGRAAAIECARLGQGIRVNTIHPGFIETEMSYKMLETFTELGFATSPEEARQQALANHPMGRLGTPLDVAKAAAFLASDLSSWITGIELSVDGGLTAW